MITKDGTTREDTILSSADSHGDGVVLMLYQGKQRAWCVPLEEYTWFYKDSDEDEPFEAVTLAGRAYPYNRQYRVSYDVTRSPAMLFDTWEDALDYLKRSMVWIVKTRKLWGLDLRKHPGLSQYFDDSLRILSQGGSPSMWGGA